MKKNDFEWYFWEEKKKKEKKIFEWHFSKKVNLNKKYWIMQKNDRLWREISIFTLHNNKKKGTKRDKKWGFSDIQIECKSNQIERFYTISIESNRIESNPFDLTFFLKKKQTKNKKFQSNGFDLGSIRFRK